MPKQPSFLFGFWTYFGSQKNRFWAFFGIWMFRFWHSTLFSFNFFRSPRSPRQLKNLARSEPTSTTHTALRIHAGDHEHISNTPTIIIPHRNECTMGRGRTHQDMSSLSQALAVFIRACSTYSKHCTEVAPHTYTRRGKPINFTYCLHISIGRL